MFFQIPLDLVKQQYGLTVTGCCQSFVLIMQILTVCVEVIQLRSQQKISFQHVKSYVQVCT